MKNTGIVRKLDELHRFVIPQEICRTHDLEAKTPLEIYVDGDQIILKRYEPACIFCGNAKDITGFKGKNVCQVCAAEVSS